MTLPPSDAEHGVPVKPEVLMTVGCAGSGKTTFARGLDPRSWVILTLDDFRQAFWGSKETYHQHTASSPDWSSPHPMRELLHAVYDAALRRALRAGWSVCLANTHIFPKSFRREWETIEAFGLRPRLLVFLTPLEDLRRRNATRPVGDRVPSDYLDQSFAALHSPSAWWRSMPDVEVTQ